MNDLIRGEDSKIRCAWCANDALYIKYHDNEWGRLVRDDLTQFEFIVLESAQAGLSWITILRKRENYRRAFADFNPEIIAAWNESHIDRLMRDEGIIRNRRKIEAAIGNARAFLKIVEEKRSFSDWLLEFFDGVPMMNHWDTMNQIPASTPLSERIASEMKKRGFRFFGPVIAYSHLQATGFINDHLYGCWCRNP